MGIELGVDCIPYCQFLLSANLAMSPPPEANWGLTHPSSAGVMASALRPNICQYHADDPRAKTVAPMGRALFLSEEAAPSVEELDVEAARYIIQFVSQCIN